MRSRCLVGIGGPSCSGKTALAQALADRFPAAAATALSLDHYYRDLSHEDPALRAGHNFDAPEALDRELLAAHLAALKRGETVERPDYDFVTHTRRPDTVATPAAPLVVIEGILALYWHEVRRLLDIAVYVEVDAETALARRLDRDTAERGRTRESVLRAFQENVLPMCRRYCEPTRRHADIVVDGTGPVSGAVDIVARAVQCFRERRGEAFRSS